MRQKLGQHFLINMAHIKRIVRSLGLKKDDTVVEIGPGKGALTKDLGFKIKNLGGRLITIEKDEHLAAELQKQGFEVIVGDVLRVLPTLSLDTYKLVGNIPYYITGRLLRVVGELRHKPEVVVLTVQREVAERMTAEPPKMNLLGAAVQYWAEPEIVGYIPRKNFRPQPEVDSAIVRLKIRDRDLRVAGDLYYAFARALFGQPRKTILNNLSAEDSALGMEKADIENVLQKEGIDSGARPHNLSVGDIIKLTQVFYTKE
jgi:16S rRNA (adenine1518-N6/adenine1519-N6)-dimethyltransferase